MRPRLRVGRRRRTHCTDPKPAARSQPRSRAARRGRQLCLRLRACVSPCSLCPLWLSLSFIRPPPYPPPPCLRSSSCRGLVRASGHGVASLRRAARARPSEGQPPCALACGSGVADGLAAPTRNPPHARNPAAGPRDGAGSFASVSALPCLRVLCALCGYRCRSFAPHPILHLQCLRSSACRGLVRASGHGVASLRRAARARPSEGQPPCALACGSGVADGLAAPTRNPPHARNLAASRRDGPGQPWLLRASVSRWSLCPLWLPLSFIDPQSFIDPPP